MSDLDPESQHVLDLAAAARTPNAGDKSRVAQRLDAALGLAATASGAHAAATKGTAAKGGSAALLKWIAGSALVTAAVASYLVMSPPQARQTPQLQTPARTAAPPPAQPTLEPAAAPAEAPPPAPSAVPATSPAPARTPHRVDHRRPASANTSPEDEIGLLHRAQAAWRAQDAKSALALLAEHRARYPRSQLAPERDALQALSLCELGRRDEGARIAGSVIARAPSSPLRASLEQTCALK